LNSQLEINLIGVSQGGLMARSILEDCDISPNTKIRNLMTVGTPNMGVSQVPGKNCQTTLGTKKGKFDICHMGTALLDALVFSPGFQNTLAPAGYYRNPAKLEQYKSGSTFLASLNNEVGSQS
jgi:palmitoyl-protein thioesterase